MKLVLLIGTLIVNLALISYSIAIISEQRKKIISNKVLTFLSLGVLLDITATVCMIAGSSRSGITFHGLLGYSSLTGMFIDSVLIWKFRLNNKVDTSVTKKLHIYSRVAYIWWIVAYVTGAILVALRHS
jgi:hypothetical protein